MQASLSVVLDHAVDVEVLDRDMVEAFDQPSRNLEMEVLALAAELLVMASEDGAGLATAVAPAELATEPPLRGCECGLCCAEEPGVLDGFPRRERGKMREPYVDAYLARSCCQCRVR